MAGKKGHQLNMHLTEESMLALMGCIFIYYQHQGEDVTKRMSELVNSDSMSYEFPIKEE